MRASWNDSCATNLGPRTQEPFSAGTYALNAARSHPVSPNTTIWPLNTDPGEFEDDELDAQSAGIRILLRLAQSPYRTTGTVTASRPFPTFDNQRCPQLDHGTLETLS
jgi:hypothetical protein